MAVVEVCRVGLGDTKKVSREEIDHLFSVMGLK